MPQPAPQLDTARAAPESGSPAEAACRAWYDAHGAAVYGYLRFHLPSPDLAEDLTAEVFLRALCAYARFDPKRGGPRPWLFRIAQNALRDERRQARRHRVVPIASLRDLRCGSPSPEERLLWEEEVSRLLIAVAELPARDRELIGLRYGSGLSTAEVGDVLGLREPAVRTRLWRALRRLREILRDE